MCFIYTGEELKDFCVYGELPIKRPHASYVFGLVLVLTFSPKLASQIPPVAAECVGLGGACRTGCLRGEEAQGWERAGAGGGKLCLAQDGSAHVCWIGVRLCLVTKLWGLGSVGTRIW